MAKSLVALLMNHEFPSSTLSVLTKYECVKWPNALRTPAMMFASSRGKEG